MSDIWEGEGTVSFTLPDHPNIRRSIQRFGKPEDRFGRSATFAQLCYGDFYIVVVKHLSYLEGEVSAAKHKPGKAVDQGIASL